MAAAATAALALLVAVGCAATAAGSGGRCCEALKQAGFAVSGPGALPLVLIDSHGAPIPDPSRVPATLCTCGSPGGHEFDGQVLIEIRGSSSAREATKKSFSFSVVPKGHSTKGRSTQEAESAIEEEEDDAKLPGFLDFPPGKHYNLYGPENDHTMGMRNVLAMWAARMMGQYASRTAYCEVVLVQDGKPVSQSHYWGIYVAMEKIERSKHRVDIKSLKPCKLAAAAGGTAAGEGQGPKAGSGDMVFRVSMKEYGMNWLRGSVSGGADKGGGDLQVGGGEGDGSDGVKSVGSGEGAGSGKGAVNGRAKGAQQGKENGGADSAKLKGNAGVMTWGKSADLEEQNSAKEGGGKGEEGEGAREGDEEGGREKEDKEEKGQGEEGRREGQEEEGKDSKDGKGSGKSKRQPRGDEEEGSKGDKVEGGVGKGGRDGKEGGKGKEDGEEGGKGKEDGEEDSKGSGGGEEGSKESKRGEEGTGLALPVWATGRERRRGLLGHTNKAQDGGGSGGGGGSNGSGGSGGSSGSSGGSSSSDSGDGSGGSKTAQEGRKDQADRNASMDITGGYIIRYEHGKTKPDTVSFTSPGTAPPLVKTSPPLAPVVMIAGPVTQPRSLPWILAYPNLKPDLKCPGGGTLQKGQRRQVLDYVSGYMGYVEQAFFRTATAPSDANPSSSAAPASPASSSAPLGPASPAAAAAATGRWRELVAEGPFIDYMLGTEFTKNPDGYRGSIYMSKDRGAKLRMGPMWDYNEAFGLCCGFPIEGYDRSGVSNGTSGGSAITPEGWRFNICDEPARCVSDPIDGISLWYRNAWKDPAFRTAVQRRWSQLRGGVLSDDSIKAKVANDTDLIEAAAVRNYNRWSSVLATPGARGTPAEQFRAQVQQLLAWLLAHVQWMDAALAQAAGPQQVAYSKTARILP